MNECYHGGHYEIYFVSFIVQKKKKNPNKAFMSEHALLYEKYLHEFQFLVGNQVIGN